MINFTKSSVNKAEMSQTFKTIIFHVLKCIPETYCSEFTVTCKLKQIGNCQLCTFCFRTLRVTVKSLMSLSCHTNCVYKNMHTEVNSLKILYSSDKSKVSVISDRNSNEMCNYINPSLIPYLYGNRS